MTFFIRLLGRVLPRTGGFDFRVIGKMHARNGGFSDRPIRCANGFQMAGVTSNAAYVSGINEGHYMEFLARQMTDGDVLYNVGANIGYLALWQATEAARRGRRLSVVAFEPDAENHALLAENLRLNPDLDITAENLALGDIDGRIGFVSQAAGDGSAHVDPTSDVQVDVARLDTYQVGRDRVPSLLVLDVEGFAGPCLEGARETLKTVRPAVSIEVHSEAEETAVSDVLTACGYRLETTSQSIWGRFQFWRPS